MSLIPQGFASVFIASLALLPALPASADRDGSGVRIEAATPLFDQLVAGDADVRLISDHNTWAEGPVCTRDHRLVWSDVKKDRVLSWREGEAVEVLLDPAHYQNGHALDAQGRLLAASHGARGIVRLDDDGEWRVLVDRYRGKRFNSPNDLAVDGAGAIWFSDPTFGLHSPTESPPGGEQQLDGEYVYRFDPATQQLDRIDMPQLRTPNGLAFSADGSQLYVADSQRAHDFEDASLAHRILVYDIVDNQARHGRVFRQISPGIPDGLAVDEQGNVWSSSREGIQVFAPDASLLGRILIPEEETANLALCRTAQGNAAFITATHGVYRVETKVAGATRQAP